MEKEELALQAECFQWHWNKFSSERGLLHANNNNSHNSIKGNMNKAIGVVAGVADLEYNKAGSTVFIEMKTPTGTQQPKQRAFQVQVESEGFRYVIIRSLIEFQTLIKQYQ